MNGGKPVKTVIEMKTAARYKKKMKSFDLHLHDVGTCHAFAWSRRFLHLFAPHLATLDVWNAQGYPKVY